MVSRRPPSPTSTTCASTRSAWKVRNAIVVRISKVLSRPGLSVSSASITEPSAATSAAKRSSLSGWPSMRMRSVNSCRWGLV